MRKEGGGYEVSKTIGNCSEIKLKLEEKLGEIEGGKAAMKLAVDALDRLMLQQYKCGNVRKSHYEFIELNGIDRVL